MILLIDNYHSAMNKLFDLITSVYSDVQVVRGCEISAQRLNALAPDAVIIGSGDVDYHTDICAAAVYSLMGKVPVMGIGLGAKILAGILSMRSASADAPLKPLFNVGFDTSCPVFKSLPPVVTAEENITLFANPSTAGETIKMTARDEFGRCLAFSSDSDNAYGLYLSPCSLQNNMGRKIIEDFIALIG